MRIIEGFVHSPVRLNRYNILIDTNTLDDLEFWENVLDEREIDYCIVQLGGEESGSKYDLKYRIYCDMEKWDSYRTVRDGGSEWSSSRRKGLIQYDSIEDGDAV